MKCFKIIFSVAILLGVSACSNSQLTPKDAVTDNVIKDNGVTTQCHDPRSKLCTRELIPVCALKNNAIDCKNGSCPDKVKKTYANKCEACADPSVISYEKAPCHP